MQWSNLRPLCGAIVVAAVSSAACGGGSQPAPPASTPPANVKRVDTATAGKVAGRVLFDGPAPQNPPIKMTADPACIAANPGGATFETISVADGGLDNVFVYVKDALGDYFFDVPAETITLDQQGCRYRPHVFGLRVGQPLEVLNSDNTLHNVHALPQANEEFNFPQQIKGMKNTKTFAAREVMVPFKCDVHGWMSAYAGVLEHPYFAVTAGGGRFALENLPPGTYTIEAWHEKLGAQTQTVTISGAGSTDVSFTFKPAA